MNHQTSRLRFWNLPGHALRDALRSGYGASRLGADALAGVLVGLVALPLSMALAIATGVPPQHGLYTAIVGGAVIALLGGSRLQVSGPTAAFVVVLVPIVHAYGLGGLMLATAFAGVILVLMGVFRFGQLVHLVPFPVTTGFTLGIAVVIAVGQLPDLFGVAGGDLDPHPLPRLVGLFGRVAAISVGDLSLGLATLAILIAGRRLRRRVPVPLIALGVVALLGAVLARVAPGFEFTTLGERFGYVDAAGQRVPGIPPSLPTFAWPWQAPGADGQPIGLSYDLLRALLPAAFAIAMLGAIESLLSATVVDGMAGTRHEPDAELMAQGVGNLLVPFFGGFAATGAIARTATNMRAGATSPIAAIVHAGFVLLAMVTLAPWLQHLPMAALAALLIMVAWHMAELRHVIVVVRTAPMHDVAVLGTCFALTVVFDMVVAVLTGIVLASFLFMRRMTEIAGTELLDEGHGSLDLPVPDGVLVYEVAGPLFFGAARKAMDTIGRAGRPATVVVLSLSAVPAIDATGLVNLRSTLERLRANGSAILLAGLRDQPERALTRARIVAEPGQLEFLPTMRAALARSAEIVAERDTVTACRPDTPPGPVR